MSSLMDNNYNYFCFGNDEKENIFLLYWFKAEAAQ